MTNQLTKEELLKAVEGFRPHEPVSQSQLKRWVKAGLLPPPQAGKSRGRGQGIPQYWDKTCIDRIKIIVASFREQKPNLDEAGRRLFAQGFVLRGDIIRSYLEEIPTRVENHLNRQRSFMKTRLSINSKAERLKESVKRRHGKDQPRSQENSSDWIDALAEVVVDLANLSESDNPRQQLGHFLSPNKLRESFKAVNDETLETLFPKTQDEFGSLGFVTRSITNMFREHGWSCALDSILPTVQSTPEHYKLIFEFRRSALLWGVLLHGHGQCFAAVLQNVIGQQLGNLYVNMNSFNNMEQADDQANLPSMPQ
jgi:hypothetical protein